MRTILLVDDDASIREVTQASLELMGGWKVILAESGREALRIAARESVDAILLDVMMPGMDGRSTLEALRREEKTKEVPVVFLTARLQPTERRSLEGLDVAGVLAKPFDPVRLHEQVAELLGWENGDG